MKGLVPEQPLPPMNAPVGSRDAFKRIDKRFERIEARVDKIENLIKKIGLIIVIGALGIGNASDIINAISEAAK